MVPGQPSAGEGKEVDEWPCQRFDEVSVRNSRAFLMIRSVRDGLTGHREPKDTGGQRTKLMRLSGGNEEALKARAR